VGLNFNIINVTWKPCWRIIPSRYPLVNLYERIVEPSDLEDVVTIEQLTNPRVRQESGEITMIPKDQIVKGPGSQYIMGPFYFPASSRFSDGSYGIYYTTKELRTAVSETKYHREVFLRATKEKACRINMRVVVARLRGAFDDLRHPKGKGKEVANPNSYNESQNIGFSCRKRGSKGILYHSVREPNTQCVAVFNPKVLSLAREERQLIYEWDGKHISKIFKIEEFLS